jgi:TlyA family rRNA methyltransferase/putative hemolysin
MKKRLDVLLVERGLAETRAQAQALILAGRVAGHSKAGEQVEADADLEVAGGPRFVSRGGEKLDHALDAFGVDPAGRDCLDVGASTGGFTDVLLQRGAQRVIALDVGYGQLHPRLRDDPRVTVLERVTARDLTELPFPPQLVVCDVSFISVRRRSRRLCGSPLLAGRQSCSSNPSSRPDGPTSAKAASSPRARHEREWHERSQKQPSNGMRRPWEP